MCGIVGYLGNKEAYPILIKGLHRLEYRGYDSAGVALLNQKGELHLYKQKGKVAALAAYASQQDVSGTIGIAHTRWATHGEPSEVNAHPLYSQSERIAIVHNGIIENYREVKSHLIELGYTFKSDTDTEVIVQLIEYQKRNSEAYSTETGIRAKLSMSCLPIWAACHDVPHATIMIRLAAAIR